MVVSMAAEEGGKKSAMDFRSSTGSPSSDRLLTVVGLNEQAIVAKLSAAGCGVLS